MSGGSSWRSPSTADQYRHHDYADFAQEFLHRNADYRRTMPTPRRASPSSLRIEHRTGGSVPAMGPELSPPILRQIRANSPALWSPERSARRGHPRNCQPGPRHPLPPGSVSRWPKSRRAPTTISSSPRQPHGCAFAFAMHRADQSQFACSIPCDDRCARLRLAAAARLCSGPRAAAGSASDRATSPPPINARALPSFLRLHDALEAGASSRDLAFGLVFPNHRPLVGATWKGSGERRHVLRLIAEARRLVAGGYRKLLFTADRVGRAGVTDCGTCILSLPRPCPSLARAREPQRQPAAAANLRRSLAMDARPTPVTARFLRTPDAAVHLGLSARTLEKHRCFGTGPVYRKLGGRIVYSR